jgi:O-antigen biosynthesis protein
LIADDASPTPASEALAAVAGARFVRQPTNLGFLRNVNAGIKECRGEYVLILNNDTIVCAGAIESMLATFSSHTNVGMVGAKLLNTDGTLQEAGGIVWRDGSAWNYGRSENPLDPRFNFVRDVDYCSGAALLIRRDLLTTLGGFDEHYLPAYYEDTDLAFRIRAGGQRVLYQPHACFYHLEGVSHGRDTSTGIKAYQHTNAVKFFDRWKDVLAAHNPNAESPSLEARRNTRKCVLIVEACMITPDQDSGSVRLENMMQLLRDDNWHVVFVAENLEGTAKYRYRLETMGVEVLYDAWAGSVRNVLRTRGNEFDAVMLCRHYVAYSHLPDVKKFAPRARVVFDTVDLHYLREEREAALHQSESLARRAADTKRQELAVISASDVTIVVSPVERQILLATLPSAHISFVSNIHRAQEDHASFDERSGVLFVGGFRHPPNIDAVRWYATEVLPFLQRIDPAIETIIVGSNMPDEIVNLDRPGLRIAGHVTDLESLLRKTRVSVAPLRFGAGVKGKINEAMNFGIPVVATSLAIEGMFIEAETHCLVANEAQEFAQQIARVYRDQALWQQLSANGIASVSKNFSFSAARGALREAFTGAASPQP